MSDWPILSLVTFLPLLGALFIMFIPNGEEDVAARNARFVALWTTLITFAISLILWIDFDYTTADFQFVEKHAWLGGSTFSTSSPIQGALVLAIRVVRETAFGVTEKRRTLC